MRFHTSSIASSRPPRGPRGPHRGSGLGLSVVKAAVELMEGRISLESAAGRGTTVTVVLPETAVDAEGRAGSGTIS